MLITDMYQSPEVGVYVPRPYIKRQFPLVRYGTKTIFELMDIFLPDIGEGPFPVAVPFFVLAGNIMNSTGVTERIFRFACALVGHIPGGLGHVNVLASVIFAGRSGSAIADTAGLGKIELQAMKEAGYDDDFSVAVTGVSSCLGPIIPPSVGMVIYAMLAGVSPGRILLAGIVPGVLMALVMCLIVYITAKKRGYPVAPKATWKEKQEAFSGQFRLFCRRFCFCPVSCLGCLPLRRRQWYVRCILFSWVLHTGKFM